MGGGRIRSFTSPNSTFLLCTTELKYGKKQEGKGCFDVVAFPHWFSRTPALFATASLGSDRIKESLVPLSRLFTPLMSSSAA